VDQMLVGGCSLHSCTPPNEVQFARLAVRGDLASSRCTQLQLRSGAPLQASNLEGCAAAPSDFWNDAAPERVSFGNQPLLLSPACVWYSRHVLRAVSGPSAAGTRPQSATSQGRTMQTPCLPPQLMRSGWRRLHGGVQVQASAHGEAK
jgi:hypothetical protein